MLEAREWWRQIEGEKARWLLIGKGPTFSRLAEFNVSDFQSIALNHAIRELPNTISSIIDLDVIADCGEAIEKNARFLLMPRFPHLGGKAQSKPLEELKKEYSVLRNLDDQKRLVVYDLAAEIRVPSTSPWQHRPPAKDASFEVPLGKFSGEVIIQLLGALGAKTIRTLGLDGGKNYAPQFSDCESTRLDNGHGSFDIQAEGIADAIQRYNLDCGPLTSQVPMRIFIGADESQLLGAKLLEYSIRKFSTISATFDAMQNVVIPTPREPKNQARTNFSFNRFAIPQLCNYEGRAVYVDADMQVFRDFRELWDLPFGSAKALYAQSNDPSRPPQLSVMLIDCARCRWVPEEIVRDMDEGRYDYDGLFKKFALEPEADALQPGIPIDWNSLEEYKAGQTGLIHYTDMHTQPWVSRHNPNGDVWVTALKCALAEGFVSWDEINENTRKKYLRPSLAWQLKLPRSVWPQFKRTFARVLDRGFVPHQPLFERLSTPAAQPAAA